MVSNVSNPVVDNHIVNSVFVNKEKKNTASGGVLFFLFYRKKSKRTHFYSKAL